MKSSNNQQVKLRKILRKIINEEFTVRSSSDGKQKRFVDGTDLKYAKDAIAKYQNTYPALFAKISSENRIDELEQWFAAVSESMAYGGSYNRMAREEDLLKFMDYFYGGSLQ
jgi:hypothetical protein